MRGQPTLGCARAGQHAAAGGIGGSCRPTSRRQRQRAGTQSPSALDALFRAMIFCPASPVGGGWHARIAAWRLGPGGRCCHAGQQQQRERRMLWQHDWAEWQRRKARAACMLPGMLGGGSGKAPASHSASYCLKGSLPTPSLIAQGAAFPCNLRLNCPVEVGQLHTAAVSDCLANCITKHKHAGKMCPTARPAACCRSSQLPLPQRTVRCDSCRPC